MATTNKDLALPLLNSTNWNEPLNSNFEIIDAALGGVSGVSVTGVGTSPVILLPEEYQNMSIAFQGILTADVVYLIPAGVGGQWIFRNNTTGDFTVSIGVEGNDPEQYITVTQGTIKGAYSDATIMRASDNSAGTTVPIYNVAYSTGSELTGTDSFIYNESRLLVVRENDVGSSVLAPVIIRRSTTVTPAAGLGAALGFETSTISGTYKLGGQINCQLDTATSGAETYKFSFRIMQSGGTAGSVAEITKDGITSLDNLVLTANQSGTALPQDLGYAGFYSALDDDGTKSSGTYTPSLTGGPYKEIVNNGAFTIAVPSTTGSYQMIIRILNGASAGAITLSGYTQKIGDAFSTTNGKRFFLFITKVGAVTLANVVAL